MSQPDRFDLTGETWGIYGGDSWGPLPLQLGRLVGDAVTTISDPTLTSADANFGAGDVDALVIPYEVDDDGNASVLEGVLVDGTRILSVDAQDTVTLTSDALATLTDVLLAICAKDVTDYTFLAQVRGTAKDLGDPLVDMTVTVLDVTSGSLEVTMTPVQTASLVTALKAGNGVWDFEETADDGTITTWVKGIVSITSDVSRAP